MSIENKVVDNQKTPSLERMICSKDWSCERALAIAKCESRLNPLAVNDNPKTGDYSIGLFQINLLGKLAKNRPSAEWLKNPQNNIDYAHKMYQSQGWKPWSCNQKV